MKFKPLRKKSGTGCDLATDDQLVYNSLHRAFPQPACLLPMFGTSRGPEVATHQRLLFRTQLASRSMLRPNIISGMTSFSVLTKVWWEKGPSMYSSGIGIACGMRRRAC